mmetsp:Transcript_3354/g.9301  ORF Transcript_3354/g.9301 Transcript_3354/m.9301 type:complete len:406 (+) Transcript_3354:1248-2465(+)
MSPSTATTATTTTTTTTIFRAWIRTDGARWFDGSRPDPSRTTRPPRSTRKSPLADGPAAWNPTGAVGTPFRQKSWNETFAPRQNSSLPMPGTICRSTAPSGSIAACRGVPPTAPKKDAGAATIPAGDGFSRTVSRETSTSALRSTMLPGTRKTATSGESAASCSTSCATRTTTACCAMDTTTKTSASATSAPWRRDSMTASSTTGRALQVEGGPKRRPGRTRPPTLWNTLQNSLWLFWGASTKQSSTTSGTPSIGSSWSTTIHVRTRCCPACGRSMWERRPRLFDRRRLRNLIRKPPIRGWFGIHCTVTGIRASVRPFRTFSFQRSRSLIVCILNDPNALLYLELLAVKIYSVIGLNTECRFSSGSLCEKQLDDEFQLHDFTSVNVETRTEGLIFLHGNERSSLL